MREYVSCSTTVSGEASRLLVLVLSTHGECCRVWVPCRLLYAFSGCAAMRRAVSGRCSGAPSGRSDHTTMATSSANGVTVMIAMAMAIMLRRRP
jgi:hypothetical protein